MEERLGELSIEAPDELAAFLLQQRLEGLGAALLVRARNGSWHLELRPAGPASAAAALALTREWLAKERIASTTIGLAGRRQTLTASD